MSQRIIASTHVIVLWVLFSLSACGPNPRENFNQTTRRLSDLTREERNDVIRLMYAEAARYEKSIWTAGKGDIIQNYIGRVQSVEDGFFVVYDDSNRPRIVKYGRKKIYLTPQEK